MNGDSVFATRWDQGSEAQNQRCIFGHRVAEIYNYQAQIRFLPGDSLYLKPMLKTSKANSTWLQVKVTNQGSVCHWPGRRQHREVPRRVSSTAGGRHGFSFGPVTPRTPHPRASLLLCGLTSSALCWCPLFQWVWKAQTAPKVSLRPISLLTPCKGWTVCAPPPQDLYAEALIAVWWWQEVGSLGGD